MYKFRLVEGSSGLPDGSQPKEKTQFENHEPPGTDYSSLLVPRLLELHRACCLILSMSGAAEYVEGLLDNAETLCQRGVLGDDGSSNFGLFLRMRDGGVMKKAR